MAGALRFRRLAAPGTTAPLTFYDDSTPVGASALDGVVLAGGLSAHVANLSALAGVAAPGGLSARQTQVSALAGVVRAGGLSAGRLYSSALDGWLALGGLQAIHPGGFSGLSGRVLPSAAFAGVFDLNVPSGPGAVLETATPGTFPASSRQALGWALPRRLSAAPALPLAPGLALAAGLAAGLETIPRAGSATDCGFGPLPPAGGQTALAFARLPRAAGASAFGLGGLGPAGAWMAAAFIRHPSKSAYVVLPWGGVHPLGRAVSAPTGKGRTIGKALDIPLRHGTRLRMGTRPPVPAPPPPAPWPWPGRLFFFDAWQPGNRLIFNRGGHLSRTVTHKRIYLVANTFALYRISDGHVLPAESLDLKTDAASWCWSMSAALADMGSADLLAPGDGGPVQVRVHVNGTEWDFIVDDPEGEEAWDSNSGTVHGRSMTALFDAPYYPGLESGNAEARLFSQVAAELFYYNGASLGVDVAASVEDWLIPAGLWSFIGTPVAALKRLAAAPDGVLSSAKTGPGFAIDPRYPVPPWHWADATPWAAIPRGYWAGRSRRRETRPAYDLVMVSGDTANGVLVPVQRDGTAGLWRAPDVIDRLMCSVIAARQRGQGVLADSGRQSLETITLPIGDEFGLVPLGVLLELQDTDTWRGLVRSVAVSVRMQGEAMDITQTLEVERHHG